MSLLSLRRLGTALGSSNIARQARVLSWPAPFELFYRVDRSTTTLLQNSRVLLHSQGDVNQASNTSFDLEEFKRSGMYIQRHIGL